MTTLNATKLMEITPHLGAMVYILQTKAQLEYFVKSNTEKNERRYKKIE